MRPVSIDIQWVLTISEGSGARGEAIVAEIKTNGRLMLSELYQVEESIGVKMQGMAKTKLLTARAGVYVV